MLHVTVTDPAGRYLPDLEAREFRVLEDGKPQELRVFEPGGLPLSVMLFLDVSSSMSYVFPQVQQAAIGFLEQLESQDAAAIVAFGDGLQILQPFTTNREALAGAVERARPRGSTQLYNALYVGLKELSRPLPDQRTMPRRRVAVLLTDGNDTASVVRFEDVLDFAKRSDIAIYAIRLGARTAMPDTGEAQFVLNQLTRQTGGRAFLSLAGRDLRRVYDDIRTELAQQYAIGYVSNDVRRDGRFRYLAVQVIRARAWTRTRLGYFAPLAPASRRGRD
jgi:Ca-activated chloride channel homolog